MALLEVREISKSFPSIKALDRISFAVEKGESLCILGPSGSGKTTLLRIIAGLEIPDEGQVLFDQHDLAPISAEKRDFGLMFQEYALFPHLNVFDNVAFGPKMKQLPTEEIRKRVAEVLELGGLGGYERRDINTLSGGEQQRVALARALAPNPRLLMLDEPLGSLDRTLRERLLEEIPQILKRVGITAIYVTHDQEEAFAVGDRVLVMDRGRVLQSGSPQEVYSRPATHFVARFLGMQNLLPAKIVATSPRLRVETQIGIFEIAGNQGSNLDEREAVLLIPPDAAHPAGLRDAPEDNLISGRVIESSFRGDRTRIVIQTAQGVELAFTLAIEHQALRPGTGLRLWLDPGSLTILPAEEEKAMPL